jgi:hypothetical protein
VRGPFDLRLLAIGALILVIGILALTQAGGGQDSPEHRSDSDGRLGTSALLQLAQAEGHQTQTLSDSFNPDQGLGLLFVFTPTVPPSAQDVGRLDRFVRSGGILVYAAERGDPAFDRALSVARRDAATTSQGVAVEPLLRGVRSTSSEQGGVALDPGPGQVVLIRDSLGHVTAVQERLGAGRVVVLADPLPLCNGYLDLADNGRLASDLVSLAPVGSAIGFDESHHQSADQAAQSPLTAPLSTPWGVALALAVLVGFFGLLLRGRRFGPRLALPGTGGRSTVEHVTAVGRLLRRARAGERTMERLREATRRALAVRHGVAPGRGFEAALAARAPDAAERLAAAERAAERGGGEEALLDAARRLHTLAYPSAPTPPTTHREEET